MLESRTLEMKSEVKKTKVEYAEIVVHGTVDKPYFMIRYKEVDKSYESLGFGSCRLDFVFGWKDECLEITK